MALAAVLGGVAAPAAMAAPSSAASSKGAAAGARGTLVSVTPLDSAPGNAPG
ncbi:hypothetical protein [Streptomyces sp. ISL-94]|uniref:hypothetical protein n=1 Tax=Streptomyces sp. ISL-94 TaxID=2819190 RepID=UPI001BEAC482|nr:hypothetical protein [Streptomyces sp. ISL-94]MBT2482345.1 hypothetical protein [Streptomyces sp. ISL-94]